MTHCKICDSVNGEHHKMSCPNRDKQYLPYLVMGEVRKLDYMADKPKVSIKTKIVYAYSEREAEEKVEQHYEDKSVMHDVSYYVYNVTVEEPLM